MEAYRIPLVIAAAFALDCALGDPQNPLHPVRFIGGCISAGVKIFARPGLTSNAVKFFLGAFLSLIVVSLSFALPFAALFYLYRLNFFAGLAAEAALCYFAISPKALADEGIRVGGLLEAGDTEGARAALSQIVGRDTQNLGEQDIVRAAVETVSENLSDGVIAPLIFICIGGAPLGFAYKAVNTLDSMIGYKNAKFEYFGKFAARLDDIINFIPARVSAVFMIIGCAFAGGSIKNAVKIFLRDRHNHSSPNSAQAESVCAGALGLRLGGESFYGGSPVQKPTIGDAVNKPEPKHIRAAVKLMYAAAIPAAAVLAAVRAAIAYRGAL
ncbi:MAG: adenosylcobinamide-phosphate synthase CbiB [Defluviitaleaceae bacterium]|nr:adenosylcobinamide-phosphate synthase CbiB [Defluviitaleaceae bacterium]